MTTMRSLQQEKYINVETFRKSGVGVQTPVWFVQDEALIYVRTRAESGKIKRMRNNSAVRVAPCKADGTPTDTWVDGNAEIIADEVIEKQVKGMYNRKYGLMVQFFNLMNLLSRAPWQTFRVRLTD